MFRFTFKTCVLRIVLSVVVSLVDRTAIASELVTVARNTSRARNADMLLDSNVKEATNMICSARGFAPGPEL